MTTRILVGDVRDKLRELEDESVQCVVTSPPYWGLRDYGTASWSGGDAECDHLRNVQPRNLRPFGAFHGGLDDGDMAREPAYRDVCGKCGAVRVDAQIGLEATPEAFVATMVDVFREVRRVLRRDGVVFLNLGDSYLPNKQLVGIPWRVAFALQADGWWLRCDIIWAKPNPMPESVTDRPTKSHEYVFLLTRSPTYYYDADAVREAVSPESMSHIRQRPNGVPTHGRLRNMDTTCGTDPNGRNKRSVWTISTQPYAEAHFATYPEALVEPCVLAGTSEAGCCPECGSPWERVTDGASFYAELSDDEKNRRTRKTNMVGNGHGGAGRGPKNNLGQSIAQTLSWRPTCAHTEKPVPCTILDPFLGSGTTLAVAKRLDRHGVGVELNPAYAALAEKRIGNQERLPFEWAT